MPIPSNFVYKDSYYWAPDGSGPYVMTPAGNMQLVGTGTLITDHTAAQLSAMALAGTLTPLATYVPSDASPPYQLWARDASTLVSPLGCDLVSVQYGDSTGATIEVLP